ncbi:MAG TPA: hypothetical protein VIW74_14155, partial [Pyrinomonadaceae bacterium]
CTEAVVSEVVGDGDDDALGEGVGLTLTVFELLDAGAHAANKHETAVRIRNRWIEYIVGSSDLSYSPGMEQRAFQQQGGVLRGFLHDLRTIEGVSALGSVAADTG